MDLPENAARALEALRRGGRTLRYEVGEVCDSGRYRLSVRYRADDGYEVRVGLVYSEDRQGLEALQARLAG